MTQHFQLTRAAVFAVALSGITAVAMADTDFVLKRELDTSSGVTCTSETAFGNFIGDALKKSHNAEIGFANCAIIRGNKTYAAGQPFTPADASAEISSDQTLAVIELNGAHLLETLEQAVSALPAASASFPQVAGLRMDVDISKAPGSRVIKLTVNGAALDFMRNYKIATTTALADGAQGFAQLKLAKRVDAPMENIAAIVAAHLQKTGVKDVKILGRIEVLK